MTLPPSDRMAQSARRLLRLAVAILIGLFAAQTTSAAVLTAASDLEESHSKVCKCGTKCRGTSCCCGPKRSKSTSLPPKPVESPESDHVGTGLCMGAAPCGDPGLPSGSPTSSSIGMMAALGLIEDLEADPTGHLVADSRRCILPPNRVSRLDEPPEGATAS